MNVDIDFGDGRVLFIEVTYDGMTIEARDENNNVTTWNKTPEELWELVK